MEEELSAIRETGASALHRALVIPSEARDLT
jgi:hypothetical protein